MGSGNTNYGTVEDQQPPAWAQEYGQQFQDQLAGQFDNRISDLLQSGNYLSNDDSGLLRVAGGRNRYGEIRPDYTLMQENPGQLASQFTETLGPSMQALQQKGLAEGDTQAATLARQQQGMMTQRARDLAQAQNQSSVASARGQLAARGGLRSGAAERLASGGAEGMMRVGQDVAAQDRAANLQISMADEANKNSVLGQVGGAEQQIGAANANRLERDIARQNVQQASLYSEDMQAYGAQQTAAAQASASCFVKGTQVELEGGRLVKIEDLDLGMNCELGGEVYAIVKAKVDHYYNYRGVSVTGGHAVFEDGKFIRVRDSKLAVPVYKDAVVYCPANKFHMMKINDITFSDLHEHDEYDHHDEETLLEMINKEIA